MKRNSFIKLGLLLVFLFITFFSKRVYAANFRYSDFNEDKWNQLLKDNKNFWTSQCDEDDEECVDKVLQNKKRFYIRLYDLLAKAENKVGYINDNYIIVTVFYGLTPDSFNDPGITEDYDPYNLDDDSNSETKDKYIGDIGEDQDAALQYFNEERDSLKELVNSFIGYDSKCYGETNNEVKHNDSGDYCDDNLQVLSGKCYKLLDSYKGTFWDSIKLPFLKTENDKKCDSKTQESGYTNSKLVTSGEKTINVDYFWEYLKTSTYFDRKDHLKPFFEYVLDKTGFKSMKELEKEENKDIYKENLEDIIDARETIIKNIKSIIEAYGENFNNLAYANNSIMSAGYWWPIGGSEITEKDGKKFSIGSPESTAITSNFGGRTDPVTGKTNSSHRGVDISGVVGKTPVIAAQDGVVVTGAVGTTGTCVEGNKDCGGGFGNYVMIQHSDGNYTIYAHMHTNSVTVKTGETVSQGQVIGYVGSTGKSTGGHLHFEVRIGSPTSANSVDPLTYVNAANPRVEAGSITLVNGGNNQQTVCKTLKNSNISNNGVAALMTNINAESGFNYNTIGDSGTSYGLCQWHNGRWDNLKNTFPNNWQSVDGQLQFLFNELHSGYASLYNSLISGVDSANTMAYNFCYYFERPANKVTTCSNRANNSNTFLTYVNNDCK